MLMRIQEQNWNSMLSFVKSIDLIKVSHNQINQQVLGGRLGTDECLIPICSS